jgi:hypothetical protein
LRRLIAALLLVSGCASPGMPPGGPPDVAAPQIIAIIPDSGTLNVKPSEILFRFDEVVSERPAAATTLGDLFLISPRDGVPRASWHRDAIGVKPAHGWRNNTPYTVIMLKGIADLRGNIRNTGATTVFSTGSTIPSTRVTGNVFDWLTGVPAAGALIESYVPPDTLHPYVAVSDSNGAFVIQHVPPGHYTVRAYLDRNKNLTIDPSEPWDSLSVNLADSSKNDFVIFTHDTVPPRIRDVRALDSLTLSLAFDKPVDPSQALTAANFAVVGPDSVPVPIVSAGPPTKDTASTLKLPPDSNPPAAAKPTVAAPRPPVRAPPRTRPDTLPDSLRVVKPVMSRPIPITEAVIKLQRPLTPKLAYRVKATGIRGLLGRTGDSERGYTPPAPPPPLAPAKPGAVQPTTPPPVKK